MTTRRKPAQAATRSTPMPEVSAADTFNTESGEGTTRTRPGEFPLFPVENYPARPAGCTPASVVVSKFIDGKFYRYIPRNGDNTPFDPYEFGYPELTEIFGNGKYRVELFSDSHHHTGAPYRIWRRTITVEDGRDDLPFPSNHTDDDPADDPADDYTGSQDAFRMPTQASAMQPPQGLPGWHWTGQQWVQLAAPQPPPSTNTTELITAVGGILTPVLTAFLTSMQAKAEAERDRARQEAEDRKAEREAAQRREEDRAAERKAERERDAREHEMRMQQLQASRTPAQDPAMANVLAELAALRAQAQSAPKGSPLSDAMGQIGQMMQFVDSIRGTGQQMAPADNGGGGDSPGGGFMGLLTNMVGSLAERLGPEYVAKIVTAVSSAGSPAPAAMPAPAPTPGLGPG